MMVTNDPLLNSYATVLSSVPLGQEDEKGHKKYSISTNLSSSSAGTSEPDCSKSTTSNTAGSNTYSSLYVLNLNVKLIPLGTDLPRSVDDVIQNVEPASSCASTSTSTCASGSGGARDEGDQGAIVTLNFL